MSTVLLIGSGGREHSLAKHLSRSTKVEKIYCLPGNSGTLFETKCINIDIPMHDMDYITSWCLENKVDLVVVGPEQLLIDGIADKLFEKGIKCFGPKKAAALMEGSKIFGKEVMKLCGISTASYEKFVDVEKAVAFLHSTNNRMRVIKFNGIAAGKGVTVAKSLSEAEIAVREILDKETPKFSTDKDNNALLIEELLDGPEISILAFTDGQHVRCFPPSQDHKRLLDSDNGPNTGGMGAYCPCDWVDHETVRSIEINIVQRIIDYLRNNIGCIYQGILYVGLMLTENGPKVLEFNCRFGDPEAQVILPLLKTDLFDVMMACTEVGGLKDVNVEFVADRFSLCVSVVSEGYPNSYEKGFPISGINKNFENVDIIHAGTTYNNESNEVVSAGGRVLSVVATTSQLMFSYNLAMAALSEIHFTGCFYRKDIGNWALKRNARANYTYSASGVNISAGDQFVKFVKSVAATTNRTGTVSEIGQFAAVFDVSQCRYKDPLIISSTDGVGTKLKLAVAMNRHDTIGQDLVAMCVNDLLCHGAEPLFFLDYFSTGKLDLSIAEVIVSGISRACQVAGCSLIGGETAEMPGMYNVSDYDLAGFVVGAVERCDLLPKIDKISHGDKIIGLLSSGVHSNGFSLVRKILSSYNIHDVSPFGDGICLGDQFLTPTVIYVKPILKLLRESSFKASIFAISHITGGGLPGNISRSLPKHLKSVINAKSWTIPTVFQWLWNNSSMDLCDFSKTFNLGIGMTLIVSSEATESIVNFLQQECSIVAKIIGEVIPRQFDTDYKVVVENLSPALDSFFCKPQNVEKVKVGVLVSGTGSNLEAILKYSKENADCSYDVSLVISNVKDVKGLEVAKQYGVPIKVISHKEFSSRDEFDEEVDRTLKDDKFSCQLICLAGFMRILGAKFVRKWFGRIINIHPSLLPSFKGHNAHKLVLQSGVKLTGATVHFVVEDVDAGGIISQAAIDVLVSDSEQSLSNRVKSEIEHKIYPKALNSVARGDCWLGEDNIVNWKT